MTNNTIDTIRYPCLAATKTIAKRLPIKTTYALQRFAVGGAALFLLAGCSVYKGPEGLSPNQTATITGSWSHADKSKAKARVYPAKIDGQVIVEPGFRTKPIQLAPGQHDITFLVTEGGFMAKSGMENITCTVKPGVTYTLRITAPALHSDADGQGTFDQSMVWVEAADGTPVTSQVAVQLYRPVMDMSNVPVILPR